MQTDKSQVPAVVLSGNLGNRGNNRSMNAIALALTKSLGRQGIPVYRFHPDRSLWDLRSRYCEYVECPNLYDDPQGLLDALVEFSNKSGTRPVLFPASDGAAQFVADHEEDLKDHYITTSPDAACISKTQHKRELIEHAAAINIPIPETFFPTSSAKLPGIAKQVSYPMVVKPLYSPDWKRSEVTSVFGQMKALKVFKPEELVEKCSKLMALNSVLMIQEIIDGPDENLITFLGYISRDGQLLAGCVRKKLRQYPPGFGYCCLTESVDDPEVFDLAAKLLKSLDYHGIGCVEFKRDPRDGKPKLIEINTRAVRTSMLAIAAGVDFPYIAYEDCVRPGTVKPSLKGKIPVRWVHLLSELRAAGALIMSGQLSFWQWLKGFMGKQIVIAEFSWDDMVPALLFWSHAIRQLAIRPFNRKPKSDNSP
jgi:predicted ATP-grasp superfamily ATP-dependent carboligase